MENSIDKEVDNLSEEEVDQIQEHLAGPAYTNAKERKSKLKYFSKMYKEHQKRKPSAAKIDADEKTTMDAMFRMKNWIVRENILLKKMEELQPAKAPLRQRLKK